MAAAPFDLTLRSKAESRSVSKGEIETHICSATSLLE